MIRETLDPMKFYEGSFADEKVSKMSFELKNKKMTFLVDGCESDDAIGNPVCYKDLMMKVHDWWDLKAYRSDIELGKEVAIPLGNLESLDEILIYNIAEGTLTLEGYGKLTNQWIKLIFTKPKIELSGVKEHAC